MPLGVASAISDAARSAVDQTAKMTADEAYQQFRQELEARGIDFRAAYRQELDRQRNYLIENAIQAELIRLGLIDQAEQEAARQEAMRQEQEEEDQLILQMLFEL